MEYVYLVYEECHGLIGVYKNPESATERVIQEILEICPELLNEQPDFNGPAVWGWEGACFWEIKEAL